MNQFVKFGHGTSNTLPAGVPNGYLKAVFFDKAGNVQAAESQVKYLQTSVSSWQTLELSFTASQNGYLQVYVANESDQEVFFDELEVAHTPTLIAQENHYYPYGMNMVGIEKQGMPHNRFQFNAQTERETAFHLHWDETPFRRYDAQIGRFHGVDALASSYAGITPYQYAFNNPVMFNDPSGLSPNKGGQEMIDWAMGQLDGYNRTQYNGSVAGTGGDLGYVEMGGAPRGLFDDYYYSEDGNLKYVDKKAGPDRFLQLGSDGSIRSQERGEFFLSSNMMKQYRHVKSRLASGEYKYSRGIWTPSMQGFKEPLSKLIGKPKIKGGLDNTQPMTGTPLPVGPAGAVSQALGFLAKYKELMVGAHVGVQYFSTGDVDLANTVAFTLGLYTGAKNEYLGPAITILGSSFFDWKISDGDRFRTIGYNKRADAILYELGTNTLATFMGKGVFGTSTTGLAGKQLFHAQKLNVLGQSVGILTNAGLAPHFGTSAEYFIRKYTGLDIRLKNQPLKSKY